jgi:hypothetical protein
MITTRSRNKRNGARIVTVHAVRRYVGGVYIKVIEKRLTTEEATELGVSRVFQLMWFLSTQIVSGNLNVHRIFI